MCHEYTRWRRRRAEEEARAVWRDFERTAPAREEQTPGETPEWTRVETAEPAEALTADR